MSGKPPHTLFISVDDSLVHIRGLLFQPGKKGGAKIEADLGIVIDDVDDVFF